MSSAKINNGKDSCDSISIYERELIPLLFEVCRDTKEASAAMLEEYERMYRSMTSDGNIEKKIEAERASIELTLKKKSKLLELVALDSITPDDCKSMTSQCNADIKAAEQELAEFREQQESSEAFRSNMERIRKVLRDAERDCANGEITKEFMDTFIDKIFATPEGNGTMRLDIKLFTGESCEKYLQKLKRRRNSEGRTGRTFKKIAAKAAIFYCIFTLQVALSSNISSSALYSCPLVPPGKRVLLLPHRQPIFRHCSSGMPWR